MAIAGLDRHSNSCPPRRLRAFPSRLTLDYRTSSRFHVACSVGPKTRSKILHTHSHTSWLISDGSRESPHAHSKTAWATSGSAANPTYLLLAACFVLALIAYAYLGFYSRYMADDYAALRPIQSHGFFGAQIRWYQAWTGRFSYTFLNSLAALFGPAMPRVVPALLLTLWFAAAVWASYQIHALAGSISWPRVFLFPAFIIFATLETAPNVSQSLYWQSASLTHVAPFIPLSLYVGLVSQGVGQRHKPFWCKLNLACAGILTFVAGGLSDAYTVFQSCGLILSILALEIFAGAQLKSSVRPYLVVGLVGSLLALTILVASPGNSIRQGFFPRRLNGFDVLVVTIRYSVGFVGKLVFTNLLIVLVSVTLPLFVVLREFSVTDAPRWDRRVCIRLLLLTPVTVILLIICCTGASVYAISVMLPERARILLSLVVICGIVVWSRAAAEYVAAELHGISREGKQIISISATVLQVCLVISPLVSCFSIFTIREQARSFAADWDRQDARLKAAKQDGVADVTVPQIGDFQSRIGKGPSELHLRADPGFWINQVTATYYGLKSVRANEDVALSH
ncbi:MAG TPA: DUF6056 family protein [Pyrinomonadaceae bacterium]|nr:DUF6056 family protein [Pyrinomonadaceae bacterium]